MRIVQGNVWKILSIAWKRKPRNIAAAYFACDEGLHFSKGDVLVVDATDGAIGSGQTDAGALRRAYEAKAKVYSLQGLHAKVYVLGAGVYVGSANASISSRELLVECMAYSNDPHAVSQAMSFVDYLTKSPKARLIDDDFLTRIEALPVVRTGPAGGGKRKSTRSAPQPLRSWLLVTEEKEFPDDESWCESSTKQAEMRHAKAGHEVSWFWWYKNHRSKFNAQCKKGDIVLQIRMPTWSSNKVEVKRHGTICDIDAEPGGQARVFSVLRGESAADSIKWAAFKALAKRAGWKAQIVPHSCREIPWEISMALLSGWPAIQRARGAG